MKEAPFAGMMGIENGSVRSDDWLDAKQYQKELLVCSIATSFFVGG